MNKSNLRILIAVAVYIMVTVIAVSSGWWLVALVLIVGGGFILYRISGSSIGITQFDFLKKIPRSKSWLAYGLVTLSTLYYVLLGFGVFKWGWVQFNVLIMLLIIALSAILAGSKDIPSSLQGVMKLWTLLSIAGILALMIAIRFAPGLIESLDYSHSSAPPEQSAQQEQLAPAPVEETISTERVVVSGRKITLPGDGNYIVPVGRKSLCFTAMGKTDGSEITDQTLEIIYKGDRSTYTTLGSQCFSLSDDMKGSIIVDFFPGKTWGEEPVLSNMYERYSNMPGGQGDWPVIRIGE